MDALFSYAWAKLDLYRATNEQIHLNLKLREKFHHADIINLPANKVRKAADLLKAFHQNEHNAASCWPTDGCMKQMSQTGNGLLSLGHTFS